MFRPWLLIVAGMPPALLLAACASAAPPPEQRRLTFDDLKFDSVAAQPFRRDVLGKRIASYEGRTVRITGYMVPSFRERGLTQFVLVRDNGVCCLGREPALCDLIVVHVRPRRTTHYRLEPITVEGVLSFKPVTFGRRTVAVYRLDAEQVR